MQGTVYQRLYARLKELIPTLEAPKEGASFYAPARVAGDIASYCTFAKVESGKLELEIAQDSVVGGVTQPQRTMVFKVNVCEQVAELLVMEDSWRYEVAYGNGEPNPRRSRMNVLALNSVTAMMALGGVFVPVEAAVSVEA